MLLFRQLSASKTESPFFTDSKATGSFYLYSSVLPKEHKESRRHLDTFSKPRSNPRAEYQASGIVNCLHEPRWTIQVCQEQRSLFASDSARSPKTEP